MRVLKRTTVAVVLTAVVLRTLVFAQGDLTPPGAPEPTMKTLQELWDELQTQRALINDLTYLAGRTDQNVAILSNQVGALSRAQFTSISAPRTMAVDTNGDVGDSCSLAFAPSGRPAISYHDESNLDLKYAAWNGASWDIQAVDTIGDVGTDTSLAFVPAGLNAGNPAISYYALALTSRDLRYAGWNGSTWVIHNVDTNGEVGQYTSLAFTASGLPAISYYDATSNDLKYAGWDGLEWVIYTVDSEGDVGRFTSLAFTTSGLPAISYSDETAPGLNYAAWNGASWDLQTVDTDDCAGQRSSLAFTPSGRPAISYCGGSHQDLKYAVWNGASWDIQTVDRAGFVGWFSSLAFTPAGNNPAISHYDTGNGDLEYAVWNGASWDIRTLDSAGDVGLFTSLAFTPSGNPAICYHDYSNHDLKYVEIIQAP